MSLPTTANRTIAPGQRVSRADLLSLGDVFVAAYQRGLTRERIRSIGGLAGRTIAGWEPNPTGLTLDATGYLGVHIVPLGLPVGVRVRRITAGVYRAGAGPVAIALESCPYNAPDVVTPIHAASGGTIGAWLALASAVTPMALRSGYRYWLRVTSGQLGDRLLDWSIVWDRP